MPGDAEAIAGSAAQRSPLVAPGETVILLVHPVEDPITGAPIERLSSADWQIDGGWLRSGHSMLPCVRGDGCTVSIPIGNVRAILRRPAES